MFDGVTIVGRPLEINLILLRYKIFHLDKGVSFSMREQASIIESA